MTPRFLAPKESLSICFAHAAYRMAERFALRETGIQHFEVRSLAELQARIGAADVTVAQEQMLTVLPEADFVALTCPLTPETRQLFDARAFATMRPSAYLINVARGAVVDEDALVSALEAGRIAGAALDCVREEPMAATAALWRVANLLITPHSAGETRRYEDNVIDLLLENLHRQWRRETVLKNGIL